MQPRKGDFFDAAITRDSDQKGSKGSQFVKTAVAASAAHHAGIAIRRESRQDRTNCCDVTPKINSKSGPSRRRSASP